MLRKAVNFARFLNVDELYVKEGRQFCALS